MFGSSAAVLVVELVALRLLAPYLGLTLETSTLVIGIALTAIAFGSWYGGILADRIAPERLLAPLLGISGVVVAVTPSIVRSTGEWALPLLVLVAGATILVPGALLSAVTPIVTKLRLTTLDETGAVVGRLSGISTAGAIAGTIVTGFILVSRVPVSAILIGLGIALMITAVVLVASPRRRGAAAAVVAVTLASTVAAQTAPGSCDVETRYHCAVVETDPDNPDARVLVLDNLRHSYVDLADPTHLEFDYVQAIASVVDTAYPASEPLQAYHLGGGGLTFPRYLAENRPGTRSLVSEIDPGVVQIDRSELGLDDAPGVDVRVEDGRLGLRRLDTDSRNLVIGDAFGGVSAPWHLTTSEAIDDIRRVLTVDGLYVANLIDHGDLDFARAEVATLQLRFAHVAITGEPYDIGMLDGDRGDGGNLVVVASDSPIDTARVQESFDGRDLAWTVTDGPALDSWVGDAQVLTDDLAPVDQLLQPFPSASRPR